MVAKNTKNLYRRRGVAMLIAMICVTILAVLAVSMASMSSMNLQIAANRQKANNALATAHSGIEVMKYWLDGLNVSTGAQSLSSLTTGLSTTLSTAGVTNISPSYDGTAVNIPLVALASDANFSAVMMISPYDADTVQMSITGNCSQMSKTVRVEFDIVPRGSPMFNHGIISRGPLEMTGQSEITGVDLDIDSSVYIEGQLSGDSFSITNNASIAGEVYIANENANYSIGPQASVGGESGEDANNHVTLGVPAEDFPEPNPSYFASFATGDIITSETVIDNCAVLNNVTIAAGTNPTFASNITINGVLYIETPNIVSFAGKATVTGIIVGNGVVGDSSPDNGLVFSGQVECFDVSNLEGAEFADIKQETGTFILAPGFSVNFSGQTTVDNGAIAASGISFTGQAGGTINGSIINYSTSEPVVLAGQSSLLFNRSGTKTCPAGFSPLKELAYQPATYAEPVL